VSSYIQVIEMKERLAVIYLHGLGSSPGSPKAALLTSYVVAQGWRIYVPELTLPTLQHLSIETALSRVVETIRDAAQVADFVVVFGSSFGGFLALHALGGLVESEAQKIVGLVLLAPVIYPFHAECPVVSPATEEAWRRSGVFPIEEGASAALGPVHYQFLVDLKSYSKERPKVGVSTLVVHGMRDEIVPHRHSVEFVGQTPVARLVSLDDDHQMMREPRKLVSIIDAFIRGIGREQQNQDFP
jgi:pimeloyl-ACP methyl ester carboxylesterase